jgi:hypothetical protein
MVTMSHSSSSYYPELKIGYTETSVPPAQQFLPVALPIMVTLAVSIWLASISQIKRLDDIVRRLERMEAKLAFARSVWCASRSEPLR